MNKQMLILGSSLIAMASQAQTDTVSLGAGYSQQVWYKLEAGERSAAAKNEWDIAFDLSGFGTAIQVNHAAGAQLWVYPVADTSEWANIDTTWISGWVSPYNSDTTWAAGAFNLAADPSNPLDQGWGNYNMISHQIIGSRLFVLKTVNNEYRKILINSLISGVYDFKIADLEGTNEQSLQLSKSDYPNKKFAYYSFANSSFLDREPLSADWDLLFTQYNTFLPTPYIVAGVLSHPETKVAQAAPVADPENFSDYGLFPFETAINAIGYDWKQFQGQWLLQDSLAYFVQTAQGDIWRIVFTGFGGSSNGNFIFNKEKLLNSAVHPTNAAAAVFNVFPNPSVSGASIQLLYDLPYFAPNAQVNILNLQGQIVQSEKITIHKGFINCSLNMLNLNTGVYILQLTDGENNLTKTIIIQ